MYAVRPELARRIVWEATAVSLKFPGCFRLDQLARGEIAWQGAVPVEGRTAPIRVIYPAAYPGVSPVLETSVSLPSNCPHVLSRAEGRAVLCWVSPVPGQSHRRWDPQHHTAATVMRAAQRWFLAFLVWQSLGRWPVPDAWQVAGR